MYTQKMGEVEMNDINDIEKKEESHSEINKEENTSDEVIEETHKHKESDKKAEVSEKKHENKNVVEEKSAHEEVKKPEVEVFEKKHENKNVVEEKSTHEEVKKPEVEVSEKKHEESSFKTKNIHAKPTYLNNQLTIMMVLAAVFILLNQMQINALSDSLSGNLGSSGHRQSDLSNIDLSQLKSTAHTIAAVYPIEDIKNAEDAMAIMFPTGKPDYGDALGVTFDDPVNSLQTLNDMYRGLKAEVEKKDPEAFARFINLASNPYGVSCEYCCGIGPIGSDKQGNSKCGCAHNPGVLSVALYLSAYTDYTDGEILREAMRWKTLWFPKNMIELGASLAGGDTSALKDLPGMVGGC